VEPNPWDRIADRYQVGSRITGKVRNLTDFGAFVEVEDGIDGLVHISDMSWTKRLKHPSDLVKKGDTIEAMILKIDSENQRLSLGMKQVMPDIWEEFFKVHHLGDLVEGKIVRLTDFGAFVEVADGIEGLVHVSEMSDERLDTPGDKFAIGQEVRAKVLRLDVAEKKIGLSIKQVTHDDEKRQMSGYLDTAKGSGGATLGDVLGSELSETGTSAADDDDADDAS
jgi:small subunit ribosomal protein S1